MAAPDGWEGGGEEVDDAGLLDGDAAERPGQVGEIAGGSDGHRLDVGPSGSRARPRPPRRGGDRRGRRSRRRRPDPRRRARGREPNDHASGEPGGRPRRRHRVRGGPPTAPRPRPTGPARPRATRNGTGSSAAGGPSSRSRDRSVGRATAGDSGRRRSAPASVWRNQPRTTCSGFGKPGRERAGCRCAGREGDDHRRAVSDRQDERVRRRVPALGGHRGREVRGQHVPPAEGDGDRCRRAVLQRDDGEPAAVGHRVRRLDGVTARDADGRLHDGDALHQPLAARHLTGRRVPAVVGGHPPVEEHRPVLGDQRAARRHPDPPRPAGDADDWADDGPDRGPAHRRLLHGGVRERLTARVRAWRRAP